MNIKMSPGSVRIRVSYLECLSLISVGSLSERYALVDRELRLKLSCADLDDLSLRADVDSLNVFVPKHSLERMLSQLESGSSVNANKWKTLELINNGRDGVFPVSIRFEVDRFTVKYSE